MIQASPFDFDRVVLTDVSRFYGRRRALNRVSATFGAAAITGLLGPNGAGKSTLLGLLATLIAPSSGEVRYGDKTAGEAGLALRGRLGLLSHELQVYPELTARENLEFFAGLYGLADPPRRASAALDRAGLAERGDDFVSGYSRGMRQRLALERALLHDPRLVLLDEPFTGLDEASSRALAARLVDLRRDGQIVVVATHDLETVDGLIDRAVMLRDGRIVTLGDHGGSLRERYRSGLKG